MKKFRVVFFLCASFAAAQTAGPPAEASAESPVTENAAAGESGAGTSGEVSQGNGRRGMTEAEIFERDIATSSLTELADWCRSLGLSEGGTKEELAARLRSHYRVDNAASGEEPGGESSEEESAGGVAASGGEQNLTITINSARTSEYNSLETVHEEYVRLRGGVSVSLRDGDAVHTLGADEILYNRTRN
ncbi:MAG: hypothetical protein LBH35_09715, partial [Treponema sp.]|nr:hypothetical protein [Treponema sp.]